RTAGGPAVDRTPGTRRPRDGRDGLGRRDRVAVVTLLSREVFRVICATCGTENRAGRKFCSNCGSPLAVACTACGAANDPADRFCGECGAALEAEPRAPAPE